MVLAQSSSTQIQAVSANRDCSLISKLEQAYNNYGLHLVCAGAVLLSFKLSFAYFFILPLNLLWLLKNRLGVFQALRQSGPVVVSLSAFIALGLLNSFFGFSPARSLRVLASLMFFALTVPAVAGAVTKEKVGAALFWLIAGQAAGALLGIAHIAFPAHVPRLNGGAVTGSGQLAVTLVVACGIALAELGRAKLNSKQVIFNAGISLFNFLILIAFGFGQTFGQSQFTLPLTLLGISVGLFFAMAQKQNLIARFWILCTAIAIPIMAAALLVNLKRGPWAGVFVGLLVLFWTVRKLKLIPITIVLAIALFAIQPVRERLEKSSSHFFVSGGRQIMWSIAAELSVRYPLGIGFKNSVYLSEFSTQVPKQMRHFHNNILNILVETGWFGLAAYLWWIFSLFSISFARRAKADGAFDYLPGVIGSSIIAWQTAGLVEYNFGDSEILVLVFIFLGILLILRSPIALHSAEESSI